MVGRLSRRWTTAVLVLAVLLVGGMATTVAARTARQSSAHYAGQVMDRYADDLTTAVTDDVERYGEVLSDVAYSLGAQDDLHSRDFTRITAGLTAKRLPGATGVAFVVPATSTQVGDIQRFWRAQGDTSLTLTRAPGATEHEFVIFDKKFTDGVDLEGTDLERSVHASAVLHTARQSGALAISPAYQLLRDQRIPVAERQTSVVLAAPVMAGLGDADPDVFRGWAIMGLHGRDFLTQTLLDRTHDAVQVTLTDPAGAATVIASAEPGIRVDDHGLLRQHTILVGQRRWHLTLWPTRSLVAAADRGVVRLTIGAGAALTMLLAVLTGLLLGSRNRALDQVDRATAALRQDITRREKVEAQLREREQQLQHLAFHDPLTLVPNRLLFYELVDHAIDSHSEAEHTFAVLFIDLDGFKPINDTFGHDAGDTVLRATADRLVDTIRPGDTAARLGGDEFAVLVEHLTGIADARSTAEHIVAAIVEPIEIDTTTVQVSASIGIAVYRPGEQARDLLRNADAAMYAAKANGKAGYVLADV